MVLKRIFLALYFLLFFLPFALAEEDIVYDLGEIVITKDEELASMIPSAIEVNSQDIEIRNAETVDEALDFTPGVRVTVGQKNEPYVTIRGFNQDKVLILLDGVPIASPYYGYVDLNQIPVESISKIKVIKSPTSALYGANAMGGVINIVTKKAREEPYLELYSGFSDRRTQHYTVSCGAGYKGVNFSFDGGYQRSDGFRLSRVFETNRNEAGGRRDNSFYEKKSFSAKLSLDDYEKHSLSASFNYIDNEKGIPPHVSSTRPRYWRFTEWKRWMLALAGESKMTDSFSIKGRVFYDKYDNTLKSYDNAKYDTQIRSSSWTSIFDEYAIGSGVYLYFDPDDVHSLKGGINFKKDVHKEQDDKDEPWETYEIQTYSFGIEYDIMPDEKLFLSVGLNYDLFFQIETFIGETGSGIGSFNPMVSINYKINPETLIYGSLSKRTRFPTIHQLYSETSGNPDLKEQRNINYEVGIKRDIGKFATVELSYFHNDVKDLIDRASRNDIFLNTSKALFEGVEADVNTRIGEYLFGRISYTYLEAIDRNPSLFGRTEKELQFVPKHKTDVELGLQTDHGFSCSLLGSYNGKRYYYDSRNNQHAMGGYFVANAKISQKFLKNWEASIFIENIFDKNYQEEEGYPQAGRTFLFSIKALF